MCPAGSFYWFPILQGSKSLGVSASHSSVHSNFVSDAIIGSLPRGLSGQEREKIFQSVPLSPTLNLLHSMPSVRGSRPSCTVQQQCFQGHWLRLLHCTKLSATCARKNGTQEVTRCSSRVQEKVSSRTLDGKRLRRHVLRGAVIVFVTAGYSGKKFIFEKVRSTSPSSDHFRGWLSFWEWC